MWAIQTLKVNFKRLMKTIIIFSPTYSSSELKVAGFSPGRLQYKAGTYPGQNTCPSQGAPGPPPYTLTHTHSDWDSWDMPFHMHTFGMWEETEYLENTYADMRKMCRPHIDSGPCRESVFFFFSSALQRNSFIGGPAVLLLAFMCFKRLRTG